MVHSMRKSLNKQFNYASVCLENTEINTAEITVNAQNFETSDE